MHIYIDESGVFKPATHPDAWCVVAAFVVPDHKVKHLKSVLTRLKLRSGKTFNDEVKLRGTSEGSYFDFLQDLKSLEGSLYCTATDMSLLTDNQVRAHQSVQASKVVSHVDKMHHESGREGLRKLSAQVGGISPQLYMQLICQVVLLKFVIDKAILFHVQRHPKTLRRFRWRIDQKNTEKNEYEKAFEIIAPGLLQSMSLREPSIAVREFDYSAMSQFVYGKDDGPTYLQEEYGIDVGGDGALNLGKILRSDFGFADSRSELGVQAVDLLASGVRRALRGDFSDNAKASRLLGGLMVQGFQNEPPLQLVSFVDSVITNKKTDRAVNLFGESSLPLLL